MSSCVFWLRKEISIKYVRNLWRDGGLPKCVQLRIGGGILRLMCTYALTLSLFMSLAAFLFYSALFYL